MTDSSPWLKRYIQNALSPTPRPQTLHGFYLQVISAVSPRRKLRVFDGHHTVEAVLSPAAASCLDADPEDLGVTTLNLTGHLIAPVAAVVVPDASTTPPTATLVLNEVRVFSDQCAQRPPGVLPPVDRDPEVLNSLRANVGRKLAAFATRSTFAKEAAASETSRTDIQDLSEIFDDIADNPALPPPDLLKDLRDIRIFPNMHPQNASPGPVASSENQKETARIAEKPVVLVSVAQGSEKTQTRAGKDGALTDDEESEQEMPELQMIDVPGIGDGDAIDVADRDHVDKDAIERRQNPKHDGLDKGEGRKGDSDDVGKTDVEPKTKEDGEDAEDAEDADDADWEIRFGSQDQVLGDADDDDDVAGEALPQTQHFTIEDDEDEDEYEYQNETEQAGSPRGKQNANGTVDSKVATRVVDEAGDEHRDTGDMKPMRRKSSPSLMGRERCSDEQQTGKGETPLASDKSRNSGKNNRELSSPKNSASDLGDEVAAAPSDPHVTAAISAQQKAPNRKLSELYNRGMDKEADRDKDMGAVHGKEVAEDKGTRVGKDAQGTSGADAAKGKQKDIDGKGKMREEDKEESGRSAKPSSESEPSRATNKPTRTDAGENRDVDAKKPTESDKTTVDAEMKDAMPSAASDRPSRRDRGKANSKNAGREKPAGKDTSAIATRSKKAQSDAKAPVADTAAPKPAMRITRSKQAEAETAEPLETAAPEAEADEPMDVELPTSVEVKEVTTTVEMNVEVTDVTEDDGNEATQTPESKKENRTNPTEGVDVIEPDNQPPESAKTRHETKQTPRSKVLSASKGEKAPAEKKATKRKAADVGRNEGSNRKQKVSHPAAHVSKEEALNKLRDEIALLRNFKRRVSENPTGFVLNPDAFLPPLPGSASAKERSVAGAKTSFPKPDLSKYKAEMEGDPDSQVVMPQVPDSAPI